MLGTWTASCSAKPQHQINPIPIKKTRFLVKFYRQQTLCSLQLSFIEWRLYHLVIFLFLYDKHSGLFSCRAYESTHTCECVLCRSNVFKQDFVCSLWQAAVTTVCLRSLCLCENMCVCSFLVLMRENRL